MKTELKTKKSDTSEKRFFHLESQFLSIVSYGILVIVLIFWTFIGFVFWIPLLMRMTAIFSFGIVYTMMSNQPEENTEKLRIPLNLAIIFYSEGFRRIIENFKNPITKDKLSSLQSSIPDFLKKVHLWRRFLFELLWTISFYVILIFAPILIKIIF